MAGENNNQFEVEDTNDPGAFARLDLTYLRKLVKGFKPNDLVLGPPINRSAYLPGPMVMVTPRVVQTVAKDPGPPIGLVFADVKRQQITTRITVPNGETALLEGLREPPRPLLIMDGVGLFLNGFRKLRKRHAPPDLGDVPLIGRMFRNNNTEVARTEILIFIAPRIIDPNS
ncbi:MAG: hypothetical protein GY717_10065 [Rhodobacteraceae bacterium]|nr:hypothetical protein [Paracoccaceae bacterium]